MVFCNRVYGDNHSIIKFVTILILIDGFLQCTLDGLNTQKFNGHNPYFNRWFSAIIGNLKIGDDTLMSQSLF